ncbi:MAG: sodium:solute symporter family protein [Alphaproteobacteria bacterium]|nr:sodium:solute symporter family protein [Alphaproteobacteria bacterium]
MIDSVIVVLYLVITLAVGIFAGRNVKNMKDFSVSAKIFPTSVLVSTIFATWMGGGDTIGVSEKVYSVGLVFLVIAIGQSLSLFFHAYVVAPRILRGFSEKISIGEIMGGLYGKSGQVITGISNMVFSLSYIAVQIKSIGYVCNLFFEMPQFYGIIVGSLIVIAYSSFGGIRSVVFTDVLQFGILIIGIPLMANVALEKVGGWEYLLSNLPEQHVELTSYHGSFGLFIAYFIFCAFPAFNPALIQRILMAKDEKQATQSLVISGILYVPFYSVITIIGLCAVLMFPGIDPNSAFLNVLNCSLPMIVKGIAVVSLLAVIMSTADSFLNVSAIAATRDVFFVLWPSKINDRLELLLGRVVTILLGVISIYIVTMFRSMIDFGLYFSNFWAPTVVAPMFLYMFNLKTDVKTYLISVIVGVVSIVAFRYLVPEDYVIISQVFGAIVTFITMLVLGKYLKTLSYTCDPDLVISKI